MEHAHPSVPAMMHWSAGKFIESEKTMVFLPQKNRFDGGGLIIIKSPWNGAKHSSTGLYRTGHS
jgi:hypothetical protein